MRDDLKEIDIDSNNKVSFLEFLLFHHKKTPAQMFESRPSAHLIAALEEAVAKYKAVFQAKKDKEDTIASLKEKAEAGDVKARAEFRRRLMSDPANHTKNELGALAGKFAAMRAMRSPDAGAEALFEQQKKDAADAEAAKVAADKKAKADSKAKLQAKMAFLNSPK